METCTCVHIFDRLETKYPQMNNSKSSTKIQSSSETNLVLFISSTKTSMFFDCGPSGT